MSHKTCFAQYIPYNRYPPPNGQPGAPGRTPHMHTAQGGGSLHPSGTFPALHRESPGRMANRGEGRVDPTSTSPLFLTDSTGRRRYVGGHGGHGGHATSGNRSGGNGGEGGGSEMTMKETLELLDKADVFGGVGGNGGNGTHGGGNGGYGHAHIILEDDWDFKDAHGLPPMSLEAFCAAHNLSRTIRHALRDYGIESLAGIVAMTRSDRKALTRAGLKGGHLATLKGALRAQVSQRSK